MSKKMKLTIAIIIFFTIGTASTSFAAENTQKLFVNLTSDEINRATMAIMFSTKVLKEKKIPVSLFLNIEAVRIVDKNIPEHKHVSGKSLKEMIAGFMAAGGRVLVCPMCMKNVGGLSQQDLIKGVEVGGPSQTWPALFADNTTVLSY